MTEQEFHSWMILAAICLPFVLLAWWLHERGERKLREHERFINSPLVILTAHFKGITREEAGKIIAETSRRLK